MTDSRLVTWFSRQMRLHQNRLMKRAGEAGKALRAKRCRWLAVTRLKFLFFCCIILSAPAIRLVCGSQQH